MLEVGGIGAVGVSLVERGAARAVNLEVVPGWESTARELTAEAGLTGRAEFRSATCSRTPEPPSRPTSWRCNESSAATPRGCAWRDSQLLARRVLVLSYPRDAVWTRWAVRAANPWSDCGAIRFARSCILRKRSLAAARARGSLARTERGARSGRSPPCAGHSSGMAEIGLFPLGIVPPDGRGPLHIFEDRYGS